MNGTIATAPARTAVFPGYWKHADILLFVMMGLVAVRFHEHIPGLAAVRPIFTLTITVTVMLVVKSSREVVRGLTGHPLSVLVFLYYGCIILTVPFALWKGGAAEIVQFFFPAVLLYAAFNFVPPTREMLDRVMLGFVVIVLSLAVWVQAARGPGMGRLYIEGTFDTNDTASIFAMALPMAFGLLFRTSTRKAKIASVAAIVALSLGVVATGSRGGFLAVATGLIVFLLGTRGNKTLFLTLILVVGSAAVWVTAPPFFRRRITSLTRLENDYNVTAEAGRKAIWARARMYIRQHPVVGLGAGNFMVAEGGYNTEVGRTGKWSAAHNAYLQALSELGFIGGGTFIIMLLTGAFTALRFWRGGPDSRAPPLHYPELFASLCAFAVGATFLSHAYFHPLFAVLGLITVADRVRLAGAPIVVPQTPEWLPVAGSRPGERGGFSGRGSHAATGRRGALALRGALDGREVSRSQASSVSRTM